MIERLLAAEDAFERGDLELAERLFWQVAESDPRNAIAAVGLARIAARRDDAAAARTWLRRALEIDPDEAAAKRLLRELDVEVQPEAGAPGAAATELAAPTEPDKPTEPRPHLEPVPAAPPTRTAPAMRRSLLDRVRRWLGLSRAGR